jgi:hypothetical protein
MAISGVADSDIENIARALGESRRAIATQLGYTYKAPGVAATDAGSHAMHVVITNMFGILTVDYGDGTVISVDADANGGATPANHTYASAGAKTVNVTGLGATKSGTVTLA